MTTGEPMHLLDHLFTASGGSPSAINDSIDEDSAAELLTEADFHLTKTNTI